MKEEKGLKKYWSFIETSVIVYVIYSLITLALPLNTILGAVVSSVLSILVTLFTFGLIGYKISNEKTEIASGKAGAWAGVLLGLISAVLGIIAFYLFPERIAEALAQAGSQGVDVETTMTFLKIGIYLNLIFIPLIYAGIGALLSWISFSIFKKKK